MDDLISRQAAKDAFMKATADGDKVEFCWWVLDGVPTIDPVMRGEWILYNNWPTLKPFCSICGKDSPTKMRYKYCPYCGARMDGKK